MIRVATESSTLLDLLMKCFVGTSKTKVRKLLKFGSVRVNEKVIKLPNQAVFPGDRIEVAVEKSSRVPPRIAPDFAILFEDDFLIAVEKPAGFLTSGTPAEGKRNLHKKVDRYVRERSRGRNRASVVHRLDREVSGIVLFAKNRDVARKLKDGWKHTEKRYYALVEGRPPENAGRIESWLKKDQGLRVFSVAEGGKGGRRAVTCYRVHERVGPYTLLEVNLKTGRKNQIRVHLSELGCPIVGDRRYGASGEIIRRIRLHGFHLSFNHPETGRRISLKSSLPPGFLTPGKRNEK